MQVYLILISHALLGLLYSWELNESLGFGNEEKNFLDNAILLEDSLKIHLSGIKRQRSNKEYSRWVAESWGPWHFSTCVDFFACHFWLSLLNFVFRNKTWHGNVEAWRWNKRELRVLLKSLQLLRENRRSQFRFWYMMCQYWLGMWGLRLPHLPLHLYHSCTLTLITFLNLFTHLAYAIIACSALSSHNRKSIIYVVLHLLGSILAILSGPHLFVNLMLDFLIFVHNEIIWS